jgi:two-component system, chemotaxis family, chemotaxis protein CheY
VSHALNQKFTVADESPPNSGNIPDARAVSPDTLSRLPDLKVLVVDDDPITRSLVRTMLRRYGVTRVVDADNGNAALERWRESQAGEPFDVVICDWGLPERSGIDVLKAIRAERPSPPFLMLTARGDAASVIAAKQSGVSGYLAKPFSQKDLEAKIRVLAMRPPAV